MKLGKQARIDACHESRDDEQHERHRRNMALKRKNDISAAIAAGPECSTVGAGGLDDTDDQRRSRSAGQIPCSLSAISQLLDNLSLFHSFRIPEQLGDFRTNDGGTAISVGNGGF